MGFLDVFRQLYDQEVLGEQTVEAVVVVFQKAQRARPYEEPHESLASTWIDRMKRMKLLGGDITGHDTVEVALIETFLHACIRPPLCARSLGIYFLYKENPQILSQFPKFQEESQLLMAPIVTALESRTIMNLYSKYNPNMAHDPAPYPGLISLIMKMAHQNK